MKETIELRINRDYVDLLFNSNEGKVLGTSIRMISLSMSDPRINQIPIIEKQVQKKFNSKFFFGWEIKRRYSREELDRSPFLHLKFTTTFEPAGEECGTIYDDTMTCEICGTNRKQKSHLKLKLGTIPKKDIARTIAGELVVSEKFARLFNKRGLKGALLDPVYYDGSISNYFQLKALKNVQLTQRTLAGINPFDLSTSSESEIYKCPKGHTIGLNLLSEPFISSESAIIDYDFFESYQKVGVRRGLLQPEPVYFCSHKFRHMIVEEELTGFNFERAHLV